MTGLKNKNIAVLAGGNSCEREVSLVSGKAVYDALSSLGFNVILVDPASDFLPALKKADTQLVFIALHGAFGEDGQIQRILDKNNIPYTGSGALASSAAFDKSKAQILFRENGIPVPPLHIFHKDSDKTRPAAFNAPFVVKPATCGSSVGISIVLENEGFEKALTAAFTYSETVLLEKYIPGRELTVGILGGRALPIVEVSAKRKFYDYDAKYKDSGTVYTVPAALSDEEARQLSGLALKAYEVLGCEVMGRVDIILGEDGKPYVLEINTIPGLTGKSLLPKAAKALGIDFPALCVKILELSLNKQPVAVS